MLTRVGGQIGRLYAWDLIGAAVGCAAVVVLLNILNLSSVALVAGAIAATGAWCLQRFAGARRAWGTLGLALLLLVAAVVNGAGYHGVGVRFAKNGWLPSAESLQRASWNSYSFVMVQRARTGALFLLGARRAGPQPST